MGGEGSGRKENPVKKLLGFNQPVPTDNAIVYLPNLSGVKDEALKTSDIDITGGGDVSSVFTRTGAVVAETNDYTWAQINKATSDIANITTKSHTSLSDIGTKTHAQSETGITSLSGSHYTLSGSVLTLSNLVTTISGSSVIISTGLNNLSGAHFNLSGSFGTLSGSATTIATGLNTLSGDYYTHAADSSDPHGANLTQTGVLSGNAIQITGDQSVSGAYYLANIIYGTGTSPGAASNYPIGSIYVKYTA